MELACINKTMKTSEPSGIDPAVLNIAPKPLTTMLGKQLSWVPKNIIGNDFDLSCVSSKHNINCGKL